MNDEFVPVPWAHNNPPFAEETPVRPAAQRSKWRKNGRKKIDQDTTAHMSSISTVLEGTDIQTVDDPDCELELPTAGSVGETDWATSTGVDDVSKGEVRPPEVEDRRMGEALRRALELGVVGIPEGLRRSVPACRCVRPERARTSVRDAGEEESHRRGAVSTADHPGGCGDRPGAREEAA